jgi:hypothetical protein
MTKIEFKYTLKDLSARTPFSEDYLRNSLSESFDKNHRNHILSLEFVESLKEAGIYFKKEISHWTVSSIDNSKCKKIIEILSKKKGFNIIINEQYEILIKKVYKEFIEKNIKFSQTNLMNEVNKYRKGQYIIPQKSFNNKLKDILSTNELKNLTHGDLLNAEEKTKLVSNLSFLLIEKNFSFNEISKKLNLKKKELVKLLKKLIKNIYKHRGSNREQFLYLKKYNLNEIETISFNARKFVKENKIK